MAKTLTAILSLALVAAAEAATLLVEPEACAALVAHRAEPDVTHRPAPGPGGQPPVDLTPPLVLDPEELGIVLSVPVRRAPGIAGDEARLAAGHAAVGPVDADVPLGTLRFEGERLLLDGRPLDDPATHALAEACREMLARSGGSESRDRP